MSENSNGAPQSHSNLYLHSDGSWKTLEEVRSDFIAATLEHTKGNKKQAARLLGIDRSTLYSHLRSHKPAKTNDLA